jgi:hypothetical protein
MLKSRTIIKSRTVAERQGHSKRLVGRRLPRHRSPPRPTHLGLIHYFFIAGSLIDSRLCASNGHIRIVRVREQEDDQAAHLSHAPKDFTEDGVDSVQPTGVRDTDMGLL